MCEPGCSRIVRLAFIVGSVARVRDTAGQGWNILQALRTHFTFSALAFTLSRAARAWRSQFPHYFARNTHSDTASPTPAATITSSSFQGNRYAVRVRFVFVTPAFTAAGLTRTRSTDVPTSVDDGFDLDA
jgi:hypothetical protein